MSTFNSTSTTTKDFYCLFLKGIKVKRAFQVCLILYCLFTQIVNAQIIKVIPNPDGGNKISSSYIVYHNQLYTGYTDVAGKNHLAKWNGSELIVIPNPDDASGFADYPTLYNDKICFRYLNQNGKFQIAQYDGNSVVLTPNPDAGYGFNGYTLTQPSPTIFNGKLYIQYLNESQTNLELAVFDGTSLQIVTTPNSLINYQGAPIIYDNKFYSVWYTQKGNSQLIAYDGSTFNIIPNPDKDGDFVGTTYADANDIQYPHPIIFNNKLFLTYQSDAHDFFQLAQYDGQNVSLIANPDDGLGVYYNDPIIYNNKLYVNYIDNSDSINSFDKLGEYNGQKLELIKNPDSSIVFSSGTKFTIYNNQLYFVDEVLFKNNIPTQLQFSFFDSLKTTQIPNPKDGNVQGDMPIVYHNKLDFGFLNYAAQFFLAQYDGQSITLITNPDSGPGYAETPFIFNDTLFFVYRNASLINHLAYLDDGTLPVSLLNFTSKLQDNNTLLHWQTASEENTNYFTILRSTDGRNFKIIGKVTAMGNSSITNNYTYTDANVTALKVSRLYYRLQEVDKDGKIINSNIQTITFTKGNSIFTVSPNPAKDFINIISSNNITDAQITVTDVSGKTLYTTKQSFVTGQLLKVSLSQFPKTALILTIVCNNDHEQFKIIKE